jgi:hypothetical protein
MDHVLNAMEAHRDGYLRFFRDDWEKGNYKKHCDSPYYSDLSPSFE